ncbi:galactan beta-1,4-galactosyltransferase GALS3-like [Malania oleifera]|uniref:galactan beta-1,4-galactosyltransferase GALS3-like n=1 Tax=Malania oleifera TaxID=397392 RepID=UPI0025AEC3B1|nr:galactan beta-1,4-galactosyltransferase GALS3-like [Malania oleifera]
MAKEREKEREKKMFIGFAGKCANELKIFLICLLLLGAVATLLQFLPSRFSLSPSDIRHCLVSKNTLQFDDRLPVVAMAPSPLLQPPEVSTPSPPAPPPPLLPSPPPPPSLEKDQTIHDGIIKRSFNPFGAAAYNFILMSAYRGGVNSFAIVGLASKPLLVFGKPTYQCEWFPALNPSKPVTAASYKILPDWGYGRVYTVVVLNCTFPEPVGADGSGGKLVLHASTGGGGDRNFNLTDTFEALVETPGSVDASLFTSPPKYDYLYCGSSLYGNLSPQRMREWIAYHVRLFGEKSHFVIHDAGGIHREVLEVLKPWMEMGYVTLQDITEQERFDGYYHNQFLVVNDCLHRYKFAAKWMFFFDVDEYIYIPGKNTLKSVLNSLSDYTQFTIEQIPMSSQLCLSADAGQSFRKWGMEKLVYKDVKKGIRRDRKYAVQPRNLYATGVHMSQNLAGKTNHKTDRLIKYFHYHGTIAQRREPCRFFLNATRSTMHDGVPYILDTTMRGVAASVKRFELKLIGTRLQRTRQ